MVVLVTKLHLTFCNLMNCSIPGFPVLHYLLEFAQIHVHESVMLSNHLILCHHLLLLPSVFPSIRVFSNELVLRIGWPKYWSLSFSISPSNVHSGLISFKIDWFALLAVQGTLKSLLQPQFKSIDSLMLSLLYGPTFISVHDNWKNHSFDCMDLGSEMMCLLVNNMLSRFDLMNWCLWTVVMEKTL